MYVTEFLHKYKKDLQTRIDDISISLTSGSASDIGHYKAMVGEIQGLTYALEHIQTLLKKVDDESDSTWLRSSTKERKEKSRRRSKKIKINWENTTTHREENIS